MARASTQHKLDRVRPPRVQVTYDVEIGNAIEMKELPLLIGVVGDFNGTPVQPLPRVRDRAFVEVNPDTFDAVIEAIHPHLAYSVDNKLSDKPDAGQLRVDLHFKSMEDFDPVNVVKQVEPLRELYELRVKLADLLGKLQGNERLNDILLDAVTDAEKLTRLRSELGTKQQGAPITEALVERPAEAGPAVAETATATGDNTASIQTDAESPATEAFRETEPVAMVAAPTEPADQPHVVAAGETEAAPETAPRSDVSEQETGPAEPETVSEPEH